MKIVSASLALVLFACSSDDAPVDATSGADAGASTTGDSGKGGNNVSTEPIGATNEGEITYYDATGAGACSFDPSPNDLDVAAMNAPQYGNSAPCGSCAKITGPKGTLVVRIVDLCPECKKGDLDLSREAFAKLAEPKAGRVKISWEPVRCDVSGPVSYKIKDGSSRYWTAIQVRNHVRPVAKLELQKGGAWTELKRESYNYFIGDKGVDGDGPFKVRITSDDGQVLEDTIPGPIADAVSQGTKNFD